MSRDRRKAWTWMSAAILFLSALHPGWAEVAVETQPDGGVLLVVQITEGPDPIPQSIWDPVGSWDRELTLNSDGGIRGDGRPDVAEGSGAPVVAWSYRGASDHDVALASWTATGWQTEFLTADRANELDPRVFEAPDGSLHATWWVPAGDVYYLSNAGGGWGVPTRLTATPSLGRRPSVATWRGSVLVAYERDAGPGVQEVVCALVAPDGLSTPFGTFSVARTQPLDAILHVSGARLWLDWKQSATEMAYSERGDRNWSQPATVSWTDPSWLGEREARARVRKIVLGQ
jgi:hypothetical protein